MTKKAIGLISLVLLMTGSIDSIRNLPTTALFGPHLIFFFVVGALFFLLPTGLISAELSSTWRDKGGIYHWTSMALGEKLGVLAIWLQWINTMVWYPTILSFIAGTATYFLNPELANNKVYLLSVILGIFWFMTLVNLKGLRISATLASWCGLFGMIIPMLLIMLLGIIWLLSGKPLQIHFTAHTLLPSLDHSESWISLTAIIASFLGMELATVHVRDVSNAQKTFPKALLLTIGFVLITMIFGSLAIAITLPAKQINLVNGVMQAFQYFLASYHIAWILPILTFMVLVGSLGSIINWLISPAKGLMQAAQQGYLPAIFAKENAHGVSSAVLIAQGIIVSLICMAFLLMPSVNGSYWLLTDLSTELYLLMYVLMFIAAIVLKYRLHDLKPGYQVPGKKIGFYSLCVLGLLGSALSLYIGFLPPDGINVGSNLHYIAIFSVGMIVMTAPIIGLYYYKAYRS